MSAIWGKVYGSLHSSVKWQRATDAARALWTTALSWSVAQGTDGNLPRDILGMLGSRRRAAENLVEVGLWEVTEEGWRFHDWLGHNVSDQQIQEQREATRARVRKHRERQGNGVTPQGSNALHVTPRNTARTEQNRTDKEEEPLVSPMRDEPRDAHYEDDRQPMETVSPETVLPKNFSMTTRHKAYAMENGLDIGDEFTRFKLFAREHGRLAADWNAAFARWLMDSTKREKGSKRPGSSVWDMPATGQGAR
jgi:hypothetical protein